nr:uncharacterized protein LOC117853942 [Setaria viridis]
MDPHLPQSSGFAPPASVEGHGDDGLQDLISSADCSRVPHQGLQALDLNSQAEDFPDFPDFPDMDSYAEMLRKPTFVGRGSRPPVLRASRRGGRVGGGGGRFPVGGSKSANASRGAGGGSKNTGARGASGGSKNTGASRGRATRSLFIGERPDGATAGDGRARMRGAVARGKGLAEETSHLGGDEWYDVDEDNCNAQNVECIFPGSKIATDKAQWSEPNTHVLCELWVEQIRGGNCHKGTMSTRGFKIVVDKFSKITGLKHDKGQLRNRINQLKILYGFWKKLQTRSGLGRRADGTVTASDWWWKQNTKGKFRECKKLQFGTPAYMDHLEEMFHDVMVDGSTSFLVGFDEEEEDQEQAADDEDGQEEDQEGPTDYDSPISTNSKKRGSTPSTQSTGTSPKKYKSPMMLAMNNLIDKLSASEDRSDHLMENVGASLEAKINEKRMKLTPMQEMAQSVKKAQELALECGATPDTVEFYGSRHLFKDPYEREFFCNIPTPEGRLLHLRRFCKENNIVELATSTDPKFL